jgi:hypothetical protein
MAGLEEEKDGGRGKTEKREGKLAASKDKKQGQAGCPGCPVMNTANRDSRIIL